MSILVPIEDAKANLLELCQRVRRGEDIVLTQDGHPVGRLAPVESKTGPAGKRPLGLYRGKVVVHETFNDPLPDIEDSFYCGS